MSGQDFQIKLLYFGHGNGTCMVGTAKHSHSFFQLEYCISGQLSSVSNNKKFQLDSGHFWLIPPGLTHKFNKSSADLDYISIKFISSALPMEKISNDPICQYFLKKICSVIDGKSGFAPYSNESKVIIENYLHGILKNLYTPAEVSGKSEFMNSLHNLISEFGATANIDILAEKLNLSRAEFKYRFLRENGNGKIKQFVDTILLNIAEQHMCYSNIPLNKIAEQMKFSSIYAFSRYYKHLKGITPSEFREQASNHEQNHIFPSNTSSTES